MSQPTLTASTLLNRFTTKAKFRHMLVLTKLAELGSMRRASLAVNMTQPAVSQLVSELEKLLETELFFRHARGVEPTEAAKDLLPIAHRVLAALGEGSEAIANRLQHQQGLVRVSASPAAIGGLLSGRLADFAKRFPDTQVVLTEASAIAPLSGITNGTADIICTRQPEVIPKGWQFQACLEDQLIIVCGASHPLAAQVAIKPEALGQAKWLLNRVGSVARDHFETLSQRHDWPLSARCLITMHIPELSREMLLTQDYLAIVPKSVALPWLASSEILELDLGMAAPLKQLGLVYPADPKGKAIKTFADYFTGGKG